MLTYVIYSHTDYLDVLNIQTEYLESYENKILLINSSNIESDIFSKYKDVIYYDDSLTYPSRLLSLSELNLDYILLIHDIDVVINKTDSIIERIYNKMIEKNIDRVDLQYDFYYRNDRNVNNIGREYVEGCYDFYLNKQNCHYTFNVNPSIWKLSSLLNLMCIFKNDTYRTIEYTAQQYCKDNYSTFKPFGPYSYKCGYFECIYFFQFLHVTHGNNYLTLSNFLRTEPYFINEWLNIVDRFSLRSSGRGFRSDDL